MPTSPPLSIADVTNRENPVAIARGQYPNVGYAHQGWVTEDHRCFFMGDEGGEAQESVDRTRTLIWDVADLDDPLLMKGALRRDGARSTTASTCGGIGCTRRT